MDLQPSCQLNLVPNKWRQLLRNGRRVEVLPNRELQKRDEET